MRTLPRSFYLFTQDTVLPHNPKVDVFDTVSSHSVDNIVSYNCTFIGQRSTSGDASVLLCSPSVWQPEELPAAEASLQQRSAPITGHQQRSGGTLWVWRRGAPSFIVSSVSYSLLFQNSTIPVEWDIKKGTTIFSEFQLNGQLEEFYCGWDLTAADFWGLSYFSHNENASMELLCFLQVIYGRQLVSYNVLLRKSWCLNNAIWTPLWGAGSDRRWLIFMLKQQQSKQRHSFFHRFLTSAYHLQLLPTLISLRTIFPVYFSYLSQRFSISC